MGADSFGDVAEGVDGSSTNGLLVGLDQLEQFKADPHPLARGHVLGTTVCDATYQVDAILLDFLVTAKGTGKLILTMSSK